MQFPNNVQAALLLPSAACDLHAIVRSFTGVCKAKFGWDFNIPEQNPGLFYRLFGGSEIMATFELVTNPGNAEVFAQPLGSPITVRLCEDVRERLMRHRAMVLVTIGHGVMGGVMDDPKFAGLFAEIGMRIEGASLPEFNQRLELCAMGARIACENTEPLLIHWTQSNQLFAPDVFETMAAAGVPSLLHVHPWLFGPRTAASETQAVGIRTFGLRHFIGREVVIEPSTLPWSANFETILAFLRVATVANGYIIPDGDCFGPEDRSMSYKVLWREAEEGDVPLCELVPLMYREFGFVSPDYVSPDNRIDDRAPPPALMPSDQDGKAALANEWREKRALAEGIGGSFEVKSRDLPPDTPPPPPPATSRDPGPSVSGTGLRARLFGPGRGDRAA